LATATLTTDRLILRPFTRDDAADVFAVASNPNVSRYTTWQTHRSIADSDAFIDMVLARPADQHTWAITLRGNPAVMGAIEFGLKGDAEAQIDFMLGEPFWNRGLMTEAARAVIAHGLQMYPSVRRIVSCALTENIGSQRVMEKCGLKFEQTKMYQWSKCPEPVEQRLYAMSCDDRRLG
jgi:ribosomal-protein-alanine N-acetyltransferase